MEHAIDMAALEARLVEARETLGNDMVGIFAAHRLPADYALNIAVVFIVTAERLALREVAA